MIEDEERVLDSLGGSSSYGVFTIASGVKSNFCGRAPGWNCHCNLWWWWFPERRELPLPSLKAKPFRMVVILSY